MKKFLLSSSMVMLSSIAMAQPVELKPIAATADTPAASVYQKQTVVRYNIPTNETRTTTKTVTQVITTPLTKQQVPPVSQEVRTISSKGNPPEGRRIKSEIQRVNTNTREAATAQGFYGRETAAQTSERIIAQQRNSLVRKPKYALANPLFVPKKKQFSLDSVGGFFVTPKGGIYKKYNPSTGEMDKNGRLEQWQIAEQFLYGITDWLTLKLQGGYTFLRPNSKQYKASSAYTGSTPHDFSYNNVFGFQAQAVSSNYFDMIVGVDFGWGKATHKQGSVKESKEYQLIAPYTVLGTKLGWVTPYLQASYTFIVTGKKEVAKNSYTLQPGLYIQPSQYFAIHPYLSKEEYKRPTWNLGVDFYPFQNVVIGGEGSAISLDKHPMRMFGFSGRIKVAF